MKTFWAMTFADCGEPAAKSFVSRRTGEKWLTQGPQIKPSTAHEQDSLTAGFDLVNLLDRGARPVCRSEIDARRNEIDQVMRDTASLDKRDFRRGNLNLLVNLNGITVDDLAAQVSRQLDSQRAFSGSSRPNDGDNWSAGILPAFFDFVFALPDALTRER